MTHFLKSGNRIIVKSKAALNALDRLPTTTYAVGFDKERGNFFLEPIEPFEIKGKIYGDANAKADRILKTFKDRETATGVLLAGEKGSGKTHLAKRLSMLAAADDIPTIVINQDWRGEAFNTFLQLIEQPVVIIFDEFDKVYGSAGVLDEEDGIVYRGSRYEQEQTQKQEALLTLLDGVYPSKKLYVFTCNDKWKVNNHMMNRPGRIYYMLDYHGVDEKFIREYCHDNLEDKAHIDLVCASARVFRAFNFDMLKALVEEMNRYGETPTEALQYLNARPDLDGAGRYQMKLFSKGNKMYMPSGYKQWHGNPLKDEIQVLYFKDKKGMMRGDQRSFIFTPSHITRVSGNKSGAYVFEDKKRQLKLTLVPVKKTLPVDFTSLENKAEEGNKTSGDMSVSDVTSSDDSDAEVSVSVEEGGLVG